MRPLVLTLVLAAGVLAQYPAGANALQWMGTTVTAGPFCWGFSCTPAAAPVMAGESGTLMVRAELNQSYVIGASLSATSCIPAPGLAYNNLVLDAPITILWTGVCAQGSPILACPSGFDLIPITIPPSLPSGVSVSIQGITSVPFGPGFPAWSFTQPITFTVL